MKEVYGIGMSDNDNKNKILSNKFSSSDENQHQL